MIKGVAQADHRIFSYSGGEPKIIPQENIKEVFAILNRQLDLLNKMFTTVLMIPAGTKIRLEWP